MPAVISFEIIYELREMHLERQVGSSRAIVAEPATQSSREGKDVTQVRPRPAFSLRSTSLSPMTSPENGRFFSRLLRGYAERTWSRSGGFPRFV